VKNILLVIVSAWFFGTLQAAGQALNGFAIGMSKLEACRYIEGHPTHSFQSPTKCPEMDDRVTVLMTGAEFAQLHAVTLAFDRREAASAIWSGFPTANFSVVYVAAVKKFGKPTWEKEYLAGRDYASFPNTLVYWHTPKADIYLERQNKVENGQANGWMSMAPAMSFPIIPPASFVIWDTKNSHPATTSWGDRATPGSER
jgi:hypothetical protein